MIDPVVAFAIAEQAFEAANVRPGAGSLLPGCRQGARAEIRRYGLSDKAAAGIRASGSD